MASVEEILAFWFGEPGSEGFGRPRRVWFRKDDRFDAAIRDRFLPDYFLAAAGQLDAWQDEPHSCLALLLLLDQFPRNLFRDRPQAYATDPKALAIAEGAIALQYDRQLLPIQRWFMYLPFEHSESLDHQDRCVALFQALGDEVGDPQAVASARRHRELIRRFGRFPHRNAVLGRLSTPAELEFLQQPRSRF
ncbi:DUF924 family protein [Synechococcus sp. PCC 7336]|uniref:DUF924 family protein n=1 Tax=Synechococcus sp. PCC 7336 TaxID=195250 RepID=UPI000348B69F|nr:DUF924 family protein [Synechococcus sp. PCC 7336]